GFGGDGGPAVSAHFAYPNSVALDGSGNLIVADTDNYRIRKITPDGFVSSVAGNGLYGFCGDGGASTLAQLAAPFGVAVDSTNTLLVADTYSSRIRKIVSSVTAFTIADHGGFSLKTGGDSTSIRTGYGIVQPSASGTTPAGFAIYSYRPGDHL